MNIKSFLVTNAIVDDSVLAKALPTPPTQIHGKKVIVPIFQVHFGKKKFLCGLAGGKLDESADMGVSLTPIGYMVMATIEHFQCSGRIIMRYLNCVCSGTKMHDKLQEIFEFALDDDHILLIGDHAGTCDGKILKHLNLQHGGIELPIKVTF